jgi:hypothetical protein
MNKKEQRLLIKIEKAGVRESLRSGHLVTQEELLGLRIQIVPLTLRIAFGLMGAGAAWACYVLAQAGDEGTAAAFGLASFFLLLMAVFGFKKTVEAVLDSASGAELIGIAIEGIAEIVSSISD